MNSITMYTSCCIYSQKHHSLQQTTSARRRKQQRALCNKTVRAWLNDRSIACALGRCSGSTLRPNSQDCSQCIRRWPVCALHLGRFSLQKAPNDLCRRQIAMGQLPCPAMQQRRSQRPHVSFASHITVFISLLCTASRSPSA